MALCSTGRGLPASPAAAVGAAQLENASSSVVLPQPRLPKSKHVTTCIPVPHGISGGATTAVLRRLTGTKRRKAAVEPSTSC